MENFLLNRDSFTSPIFHLTNQLRCIWLYISLKVPHPRTMVPLTNILLSALLICVVAQVSTSGIGMMNKSSVEPERDDHKILSNTYNTGRQLLPHPPHKHDHPHPHPHPPSHHNNEDSIKYTGCLGLSEDELASIWESPSEEAPPCTISVNGIVVAGNDGSLTETESSTSSGSDTSGSGSGGSSESNSSNSGSNGSSTSGSVKGEDDRGINKVEDHEDDSDESSGGYYSYELDGSNEGDESDNNSSGSGIGGDDFNETKNSSGSDTSNGTSSGTNNSTNDDDDKDVSSPLMYFNISDCGSYANMWIWDLAMTCSDSSMNQTDCQCTSAEILMQYGKLYCPSTEDPVCPDNCSVCHTCMELLGCSSPDDAQDGQYLPPEQVLLGDGASSTILPLALGIAAAILGLVGSSYYQYTHRNIDTGAFPSLELEPPSNASML